MLTGEDQTLLEKNHHHMPRAGKSNMKSFLITQRHLVPFSVEQCLLLTEVGSVKVSLHSLDARLHCLDKRTSLQLPRHNLKVPMHLS